MAEANCPRDSRCQSPLSMSRRSRATPKRCYGKDGSAFIRRNLRRMEPKPRTDSLAARAIRSPGRALGLILGVHTLVWTALPVLLYANLPLDLIEALMYGREWQLGYDKLPPLPWWLVELAYLVTGHDWSYYLLAQIAVCAALAVIYLAARPRVAPWLTQRADRRLAAARHRRRHVALGEVFRRRAGGADGGVRTDRPRRAQVPRHAGALRRRGGRAGDHGAAFDLARAQRLPALRLCRAPRRAVARLVRSRLASGPVRGQPALLPHPVADHRRAFVRPEAQGKRGARRARRRCLRPAHRGVARLRSDRDGARHVTRLRPRHGGDVGLSALAVPRPVAGHDRGARAHARPPRPHRPDLGDRVRVPGPCLHRQLRRSAALRSSLPRRVLPRRGARPRHRARLARRDRQAAPLRHRHDVGRRQRRALLGRSAARAGRRQAGAGAVDRPRRSQEARRGRRLDRW